MKVGGQLHAPVALPRGKENLVPIAKEAGWAPTCMYPVHHTLNRTLFQIKCSVLSDTFYIVNERLLQWAFF